MERRSLEDPKVPSTGITVFLSYLNHWERVATLSLTPSGSELLGNTTSTSFSESNHIFKLVICEGNFLSKEFLKIELPTSNWMVEAFYMQSVLGGREFSVMSHPKKR
jgi:hypothetical protein